MEQRVRNQVVDVIEVQTLYKWSSIWGRMQRHFYLEPVQFRREKQIIDFMRLNGFERPFIMKDTDIFLDMKSTEHVTSADIVIITDQKFSRLPCRALIDRVQQLLHQCPAMILCLNRHYINIDHAFIDSDLSDHFPLAITQWLKTNLRSCQVIDMSLDVLDKGDWFTWVVPDRMYYIQK